MQSSEMVTMNRHKIPQLQDSHFSFEFTQFCLPINICGHSCGQEAWDAEVMNSLSMEF
jgi:hypothetical protein